MVWESKYKMCNMGMLTFFINLYILCLYYCLIGPFQMKTKTSLLNSMHKTSAKESFMIYPKISKNSIFGVEAHIDTGRPGELLCDIERL